MDWYKLLWFAIAFIPVELFALLVFYFVRKKYEKNSGHSVASASKGILERFCIVLGLVAEIPTIIIFFSALKLGTRLKEQQESKISNDYFLVGNIISIVMAITAFLIYQILDT